MLLVRSTSGEGSDLTTRARIRDTAIELIGENGFARVTVRQVAAAVGVSPGLVIHHFRSKEGLRDACDAHVLAILSESIAGLTGRGPAGAIAEMARAGDYVPSVRYITRTLVDGGPAAQHMFDKAADDVERWLRESVADGSVHPTTDERARAKLLICISLGLQIMLPYLVPGAEPGSEQQAMLDLVAGPAIELYTHGLFTGTEYFDALRKEYGA